MMRCFIIYNMAGIQSKNIIKNVIFTFIKVKILLLNLYNFQIASSYAFIYLFIFSHASTTKVIGVFKYTL